MYPATFLPTQDRFATWNFGLGIRNALNAKPPYATNNDDMNTIHFSYDTAGRYFYGRVSYTF